MNKRRLWKKPAWIFVIVLLLIMMLPICAEAAERKAQTSGYLCLSASSASDLPEEITELIPADVPKDKKPGNRNAQRKTSRRKDRICFIDHGEISPKTGDTHDLLCCLLLLFFSESVLAAVKRKERYDSD